MKISPSKVAVVASVMAFAIPAHAADTLADLTALVNFDETTVAVLAVGAVMLALTVLIRSVLKLNGLVKSV